MSEEWTVDQEEFDRLTEEAQKKGEAAQVFTPTPTSWGFFSYGDGPPAAGGGVGAFMWFSSRSEMLDYVGRLLTFLSPGPSSVDPGKVSRAVSPMLIGSGTER